MSKQQLKEEMRQSDGAPELKQALRARQQEVAMSSARKGMADASVVLTNPTHFAVALRYRPGLDAAPLVVARGRGEIALAIKALAKEKRVPTLEYSQLTRAIYFTTRTGRAVSEDLYVAVAAILAFVFRLESMLTNDLAKPVVEVPADKRFDTDGRRRSLNSPRCQSYNWPKELGMLTSIANNLGFGSGINTAALVAGLAAASRTPKVQRFDALARANQAKISTLAQARSDLESFADSLADLASGGTLRSQPVTSDNSAITVTSTPGTLLGSYAGEIVINSLAKAQTIYSGYTGSAIDPIGQGGMTLTVGATNYSINVDDSNDNLNGLASAINASGSGVRARVINDTGNFRLVLKGESGAAKAFTLSADQGADPGLAQFASAAMTAGQTASDAAFTVDGVAYTRATNSFSDVVPGMTISLKKADTLTIIAISSTRPNDVLKQTLGDFVSVFNTLKDGAQSARVANNGNPALRAFER